MFLNNNVERKSRLRSEFLDDRQQTYTQGTVRTRKRGSPGTRPGEENRHGGVGESRPIEKDTESIVESIVGSSFGRDCGERTY